MTGDRTSSALHQRIFITSSEDGHNHLVDDHVLASGLTYLSGRFTAVCGRSIVSAPMVAPPGPDCPHCCGQQRTATSDHWGPAVPAPRASPEPTTLSMLRLRVGLRGARGSAD